MAKAVKLGKGKEFVFKKASGGGGESRYDWANWLNGDLLLLEQSEGRKDEKGNVVEVVKRKDYEVDNLAIRNRIKVASRKLYKVTQVSGVDADGNRLVDSVIIRARDMTPEERVAEDALRAEEKVAAQERRAEKKAAAQTNGAATSGAPTPTAQQ